LWFTWTFKFVVYLMHKIH